MISLIKKIAHHKVTRKKADSYDEMCDFLMDWWSTKYNLPINHPLLLSRNFDELLLEYYVDLFKNDEEFLRAFELELQGKKINEDDEEWFKEQMGDDYIAPNQNVVENSFESVFTEKYEE